MGDVYTDALNFDYGEIGEANKMQLIADNARILKDVIVGDDAESSGWPGHSHKGGSTFADDQTEMGAEVVAGSRTYRGGVTRKQSVQSVPWNGGSHDCGAFPATLAANEATIPIPMARYDLSGVMANLVNTDFSIGHAAGGTYGYIFFFQQSGSYWHLWLYNYYTGGVSSADMIAMQTSVGA